MNLYIIRHGRAETYASSDSARRLVSEGEQQVRQLASQFRTHSLSFDKLICSPYTRAQQTAQIIKAEIGFDKELITCDDIVPDGDVSSVIKNLNAFGDKNILLVSHMPLLGYLASYLLLGEMRQRSFSTAQAMHLSGEYIAPAGMTCMASYFPS